MKKLWITLSLIKNVFELFAQTGNVGVNTGTPANNLTVSGNFSVGSAYTGIVAPNNGALIQGSVGIGIATPLNTSKLEVLSTTSALDAIRGNCTSGSVTGTFGGVRGNITNIGFTNASAYLAFHAPNNVTFGVHSIGGDYGGWFDRPVGIGVAVPVTTADLEVRNIVNGNPATVFLRQGSVNSTSGNLLGSIDFGDNRNANPQAQIKVSRSAPSSSAIDVPTDFIFSTTPDGTSTPIERMRIMNTGAVGFGSAGSAGASGQVLFSNGPTSPPTWGTISDAPLGQNGTTVYGTASLMLDTSTTSYATISGLSQTVLVPVNGLLFISTDGGIENLFANAGYAIADIALFVDGIIFAGAGKRRVTCMNTWNAKKISSTWALSCLASLAAGIHTIEVKIKFVESSASTPPIVQVSGNASSQNQGMLSVVTLRQ